MADNSSKWQKLYIFSEIYFNFTLKIMCMYFIISHNSHFWLQVLAHVRLRQIFTAQLQAYEILDFIHFKALVTSFDFCKWSPHYLVEVVNYLHKNFVTW